MTDTRLTASLCRAQPRRNIAVKAADPFRFRAPMPEDGSAVWDLIKSCGPLDDNSMYCNLLQCDHFSDTCILAEDGEGVCGWISGYLLPNDPGTLFVWQVATSARARGQGLAKRMLTKLIDRPACEAVIRLQTTITRDNKASWALFTSFARHMAAPLSHEAHFKQEEHFDGNHDTEYMVTIGDFGALKAAA